MSIPNVIADRYSSNEIVALFDQEERVKLERRFWVEVLKAQISVGLKVDSAVIADYEKVIDNVDLQSIRERERLTKHDIPARLHEFNELAGHQHMHKGLTSRDLTENVEQLVSWNALQLVESRTLSLLRILGEKATEFEALAVVGRTHNVPAQPTTVGKRFAQLAEELLAAYERLQDLIAGFALRGIKGPVGSQQDQVNLLGSVDNADRVEQLVAEAFGIGNTMDAVGQVYPRSLDFAVSSVLFQLGSAPANLALLIRLMASHELASEGFQPGQVGSSAMPHKMNARSCERINGLYAILQGYMSMSSSLAGNQWNEGDVSCSVVRRVVIPNSFLTLDGLYETTFAVLREFTVFPKVVQAELSRYLPFLSTTTLLMHAVKNGMGREEAHEVIKEHAVATAMAIREGTGEGSLLLNKLGEDKKFPGSETELADLVNKPEDLLGNISMQVKSVNTRINKHLKNREDSTYQGAEIL